jgi:hypothetical protein
MLGWPTVFESFWRPAALTPAPLKCTTDRAQTLRPREIKIKARVAGANASALGSGRWPRQGARSRPGKIQMAAKTKVEIDIDITPDMLAAGLQVLVDSGREPPTGADEVLVTDIYKAMVRARSRDATVHVTVPGVIEPGAELVVKNESDHPICVVADPHERLTIKTRERPRD